MALKIKKCILNIFNRSPNKTCTVESQVFKLHRGTRRGLKSQEEKSRLISEGSKEIKSSNESQCVIHKIDVKSD